MKLFRFNEWALIYKMMAISGLTVTLFLISLFFVIMPRIETQIYLQKRHAIVNLVQAAESVAKYHAKQVKVGKLDQAHAKQMVIQILKNMRYDDGNYLWINDVNYIMLMHPAKPELVGQNVKLMKDAEGTEIFQKMVEVCQTQGAGDVWYLWPKAGSDKPVKKLSYVKFIPEWNWVIGTGVYVEDIEKELNSIKTTLLLTFLLVGAVAGILSFVVARRISGPVRLSIQFAEKVADGNLTQTLSARYNDEIGSLTESFNRTVLNVAQIIRKLAQGIKTLGNSSSTLTSISEHLSVSANETSQRSELVSDSADKMSSNINGIAAASEQASQNVTMIATAAEEMTETINEINHNTNQALKIVKNAVEKVEMTSNKVNGLGMAALEINKVTEVINEISEQTNLLALNATIEAARGLR